MTTAFSSATSRRAPLGGAFIAVAALLAIVGTLADYISAESDGLSLWGCCPRTAWSACWWSG